ncbi:MAG TPA: hypothetical protein VH092_18705 [Urbifossiella sp.]|jgi:hypothetical protein|nr:hypothetical protein [Urbifossiella sp.]
MTDRRAGAVEWPGTATVTFSDALAAVRRIWADGVFPQPGGGAVLTELPESVRELRLTARAPAA